MTTENGAAEQKDTAEQKEEVFKTEDELLYETAEAKSDLAGGGCGVCQRKGFPLFLVRKSIVKKQYRSKSWSRGVEQMLGREPEAGLQHYEYSYRTLRTGYVYIRLKDGGKCELLGYEVTPSGVFRHKSVKYMKERIVKEIPKSCIEKKDNIPGAFIHIDTEKYKGDALIAYSRRAWSESTRDYYCKLDDNSPELKRFTKIKLDLKAEPKDLCDKARDGQRSFSFADFLGDEPKRMLMELQLEDEFVTYDIGLSDTKTRKESVKKSSDNFYTVHQFNSLKAQSGALQQEADNLCSSAKGMYQVKDVAAVVVEDTLGLAEELAYQRQREIQIVAGAIAAAEKDYVEKMQQAYATGSKDKSGEEAFVDDILKTARAQFEKDSPQEATLLYKDNASIPLPNTYGGVPNVPYGVGTHETKKIEIYLKAAQAKYGSYFDEKYMHLRKTFTLVENYRRALQASCEAEAKDRLIYQPIAMGDVVRPLPGSVEVPIGAAKKAELLEQFNRGPRDSYDPVIVDVKAYKVLNTAAESGKKEFEKKWSKLKKRLDKDLMDAFAKKDKEMFDELVKQLTSCTKDYCRYIKWLLDTSPEGENKVHFWRNECETGCSNNHIGYLADFIRIVDMTMLSNVQQKELYELWEMIVIQEDGLFSYLLNGKKEDEKKNSFWTMMLKTRSEANQAGKPLSTEQALAKVEKECKGILDDSFTQEKAKLVLDLYSLLIQKASAGLSQRSPDTNIDEEKRKKMDKFLSLLCQTMMVVNNIQACRVRIDKIDASCASVLARNLTLNMAVFCDSESKDKKTDKIDPNMLMPAPEYDNETENKAGEIAFEFWGIGQNLKELHEEVGTLIGKSVTELETELTARRANSDNWGLIQLTDFPLEYKRLNELAATSGKLREIKVENTKAGLLSGIDLAMKVSAFNENRKQLEDRNKIIDQKTRDTMLAEHYSLLASITALSVQTLSSSAKVAGIQLFEMVKGISSLSSAMENVTKALYLPDKAMLLGAEIILAAVSIIEGANHFLKGKKMREAGSTSLGDIYVIGGGFQVFAGVMLLLKYMGVVAMMGPIGFLMFYIGLVVGVVATIIFLVLDFIDDSDSWSPMDLWMNRCPLGNKGHKEKGIPYPWNYLGMACAINDYMVAWFGLSASVSVEVESALISGSTGWSTRQAEIGAMSDEEAQERLGELVPGINYGGAMPGGLSRESASGIEAGRMAMESRGLYIQMEFPNYDKNKSYFEGKVRILNRKTGKKAVVSVSKGDKYPEIKDVEKMDSWVLRSVAGLVTDEDELANAGMKKEELYGIKVIDIKDENTGKITYKQTNIYQVLYKIGEFSSSHDIYYQLKYWPSKTDKPDVSLVLAYSYQAEV
ncbi:toxin VasX [Leminorella grimontii]|uniref:toxin VasX n=1 Tax=Leminorella grimontii TaxID=82981 RepID=UPI00207E9D37|nr:toxin VasX [Leminorella grimontii]GKX60731.1 hypothetical protein SOASR031_30460 [Leminorella grimontii]